MNEIEKSGEARPLISVVITCYNLAAYIREAIDSVLAQELAGPFEIIVVDDCSTDDSSSIIATYSEARLVSTSVNGGVMLATVAGVQAARGDIVALLDGDDTWEPGKLAAVRAQFADPRVGFVTHDLVYADAECRPTDAPTRPRAVLGPASAPQREALLRDGLLNLGDYIWLGSAFSFRKSRIKWANFIEWVFTLPDPRNVYQDWPLAYWIALQRDVGMVYIDEKLFRYRLHGANHSGDARTVQRAVRNYRRAFLTISAIEQLARRDGRVAAKTLRIVTARVAHNAARLAAHLPYQQFSAVRHHVRSLPDLRARGVMLRETVVLGALVVLGPSLARRLSAARSAFS
ncbi:glycosyltransferase [Novosphingobium sp.]|uniref:glycosyltransferase n=1 Tax=Novosphingobium sp. TaxID=1874826 RepID=UPI00286E9E59|nr:glycosyltransferase [Novosphingobium sp.]